MDFYYLNSSKINEGRGLRWFFLCDKIWVPKKSIAAFYEEEKVKEEEEEKWKKMFVEKSFWDEGRTSVWLSFGKSADGGGYHALQTAAGCHLLAHIFCPSLTIFLLPPPCPRCPLNVSCRQHLIKISHIRYPYCQYSMPSCLYFLPLVGHITNFVAGSI